MIAVDVELVAKLAFAEAELHPPRSAERRAASHLWVSCTVPPARSVAAAKRAIASFGDERTQADASALLHQLAAAATEGTPV